MNTRITLKGALVGGCFLAPLVGFWLVGCGGGGGGNETSGGSATVVLSGPSNATYASGCNNIPGPVCPINITASPGWSGAVTLTVSVPSGDVGNVNDLVNSVNSTEVVFNSTSPGLKTVSATWACGSQPNPGPFTSTIHWVALGQATGGKFPNGSGDFLVQVSPK